MTNPRIHPWARRTKLIRGFNPKTQSSNTPQNQTIMAHTNIWVHLVWGTKRREPLLEKSVRFEIFEHIRETARKKDIHVDFINGFMDLSICWSEGWGLKPRLGVVDRESPG